MKTALVTELKRHATDIIAELQRERSPILVTERGKPAAYLVDVNSFESMRIRTAILEGIARGERAVEDGRTVTHKGARSRMRRWLK